LTLVVFIWLHDSLRAQLFGASVVERVNNLVIQVFHFFFKSWDLGGKPVSWVLQVFYHMGKCLGFGFSLFPSSFLFCKFSLQPGKGLGGWVPVTRVKDESHELFHKSCKERKYKISPERCLGMIKSAKDYWITYQFSLSFLRQVKPPAPGYEPEEFFLTYTPLLTHLPGVESLSVSWEELWYIDPSIENALWVAARRKGVRDGTIEGGMVKWEGRTYIDLFWGEF
jgi:hypothetical protein